MFHFLQNGFVQNQRAGQGYDRSECLVILEPVPDGSEAAHGEASDVSILALVRERECLPGEFHQLFSNEFTVAVHCVIQIHGVVTGRHHDCQILLLSPPLDPCTEDPVRIVSDDSVKQIECLVRFSLFSSRHSRKISLVCGQDHEERNRPSHCLCHKVNLKYCHDALLF